MEWWNMDRRGGEKVNSTSLQSAVPSFKFPVSLRAIQYIIRHLSMDINVKAVFSQQNFIKVAPFVTLEQSAVQTVQ